MQNYNSFNELASAQSTSPLVSAMSVFNEVTPAEYETVNTTLQRILEDLDTCSVVFDYSHDPAHKSINASLIKAFAIVNDARAVARQAAKKEAAKKNKSVQ